MHVKLDDIKKLRAETKAGVRIAGKPSRMQRETMKEQRS